MSERRPSFPFYPKDWLASASVSSMPLAAQGLYVRLMAFAWQADGLPCSDEALRNLVGLSRSEWRKLWPHVAPMWREENGRLFNRKLEQVRAESAAFSEAARVAGRASAAARAQRNGNGTGNETGNETPTEGATEPATEIQPAFASSSSTASTDRSSVGVYHPPVPRNAWLDLVAAWNDAVRDVPVLAQVDTSETLPEAQSQALRALRACPDVGKWEFRFTRVARSSWLTGKRPGRNGEPFIADLWWVLKNVAELDAGRYDDREKVASQSDQDAMWARVLGKAVSQ